LDFLLLRNLIDQSNQFNQTIEHFGEDIAVVHILSGMEPMDSDIIANETTNKFLMAYSYRPR
jgi:hypothetical protein